MTERARQFDIPEVYFQLYGRMLKMLYMDSRYSLIRLLNVLNVFRTVQKNLNIYFLDLNGLPHALEIESVRAKTLTPLER
jgi:hypothetical protein